MNDPEKNFLVISPIKITVVTQPDTVAVIQGSV